MKEETAIILNNAIAENDHDLFVYNSALSQDKIKWIEEYLYKFLEKDKTLVELGCGVGKFLFKIEELGLKTIGLEISNGMIKRFNENKRKIGSNTQIIEGSYFKIPLENNCTDYILFAKNIVECSYNEFEIICREAKRILVKNGKFIITMTEDIKKHERKIKDYNILDGSYTGEINTPTEKGISYPTFYWTIGFANYILSKKFVFLDKIMGIDENGGILMVYEKKNYFA